MHVRQGTISFMIPNTLMELTHSKTFVRSELLPSITKNGFTQKSSTNKSSKERPGHLSKQAYVTICDRQMDTQMTGQQSDYVSLLTLMTQDVFVHSMTALCNI